MQKSVLIVEDEFLIAMDLEFMLEEHGWRVTGMAPTVKDALRLLEIERPSVALLDVNLGTELVSPFAEVLKAKGVPFALASAYNYPELIGGAVLVGVPNVGKPANQQRVLATLDQLIGRA